MMTNEKPGGHGERSVAVGTIDMAVWDAVAKIERKPLFQLLAERYGSGKPNRKVFVYAAGGYYYPGQGLDGPAAGDDELHRARLHRRQEEDRRRAACRRPAADRSRARDPGAGQKLAVDANGRFDRPTAIEYAKALSQYDLFWYEEPGDPLDFELQAELANHYQNSMATGENLFSMQDARNLIRYGGMRKDRDWLQFDCALSYGLVEYLRTLDMLRQYGWSPSRCVPHGGHQMSLAIAAGLGLAATSRIPTCSSRTAVFRMASGSKTATSRFPTCPASGSRARPTSSPKCARWRPDSRSLLPACPYNRRMLPASVKRYAWLSIAAAIATIGAQDRGMVGDRLRRPALRCDRIPGESRRRIDGARHAVDCLAAPR